MVQVGVEVVMKEEMCCYMRKLVEAWTIRAMGGSEVEGNTATETEGVSSEKGCRKGGKWEMWRWIEGLS
jgi:hypothetical protein